MGQRYTVTVNGITIIAETLEMGIPAGGKHVRQAAVFLPRFKSEPVVTATVHSKDSNGTMFSIWNITYLDTGHSNELKFSAANVQIGQHSDYQYLCSFTAVGELAE